MVDLHPEHARAVLEGLPIGVVLIDNAGRVSWANGSVAEVLQTDAQSLLGLEVRSLPLPYDPVDNGTDDARVRVDGTMIGITRSYEDTTGRGDILMVLDRGHALVWFLSALSSGVPGAVAASGVLSHGAIHNRLEPEVSRSRRYANPLSCIALRFIGDTIKHHLDVVAKRLKGQLRWVDLLGEYNEDSLLIVLPETTSEAAEALRAKLEFAVLEALACSSASVEVCLGCSAWQRGESAQQLVQRALVSGVRLKPATTLFEDQPLRTISKS